jgi:Ca2+-binding EF-hand superfamily protein
MCQSLTESNRAHHLAEILFKAYNKNINGSIDFSEMIDFVWTVIDAPYEEQIAGLYQALRESNGKLSKDRLIEFLTILKEDFQTKKQSQLKTDEEIRNRVDECFDYFLGSKDPLVIKVKTRWDDRIQRRNKKKKAAFH